MSLTRSLRFKRRKDSHSSCYLDKNKVKTILEQLAFYKKAHKTDRACQFWQEGVYPELIQNEETMRQKIEYIRTWITAPYGRG